ncbi:uncharacterized protein LOC144434185 [Glandiceps talaboti]
MDGEETEQYAELGAVGGEIEDSKRPHKPTPAFLEEERKRLKGQRSGACGQVTGRTNEIQVLLKNAESVEAVSEKLAEWEQAYVNLQEADKAYHSKLDVDEQKMDYAKWVVPKFQEFDEFRSKVSHWLQSKAKESATPDTARAEDQHVIEDQGNAATKAQQQFQQEQVKEPELVVNSLPVMKSEQVVSKEQVKEPEQVVNSLPVVKSEQVVRRKTVVKSEPVETVVKSSRSVKTEVDVEPDDSISNIGRKGHTKSRKHGSGGSGTSSRLSERSNTSLASAVAKRAALKARVAALKERQALEECEAKLRRQQEEIQRKKDMLAVNAEIAEEEAKIKAYEQYEDEEQDIEQSDICSSTQGRDVHQDNDQNMHIQMPVYNNGNGSNHGSNYNNMQTDLAAVLQHQNYMTKVFMDRNDQATLPPQTLPVFRGDPLKYRDFVMAFKSRIEAKTSSDEDRLYYLQQYTADEPGELVASCIHMDPNKGYKRARDLLEKRYGNSYVIGMAYTKEAEQWPDIKAEDKTAMCKFAVFLAKCENMMNGEVHLKELDYHKNLQMLVDKLPYKMREQWRRKTYDLLQHRPVEFRDLVRFVQKEADVMSNAVFGNLNHATQRREDKSNVKSGRRSSTRPKGSSFAISTDGNDNNGCDYCADSTHRLQECKKLASKPYKERMQFLKSKGLCYGCLTKTNHLVKGCGSKMTCGKCKRQHPTLLHQDRAETSDTTNKAVEPVAENSSTDNKTSDAKVGYVDVTCQYAGTKDLSGIPVILPVVLRCKSSGASVQTYAFLDNGSDAVFCTEAIRQQLNTGGQKTKLNVHTMTETKVVNSYILKGLEVTDLDGNNVIQLPATYTHSEIPVSKKDIVKQEDITRWPYLRNIHLPSINADIGLLIGNNVPKALEPWEVINSQDDGPYAVKTLLGWAVNGPLKGAGEVAERVSVNRIKVDIQIEQQLASYFNQEFSEKAIDDKPERSVEDTKFMHIMMNNTNCEDGHYQVPLPFRHPDVKMPNNRSVAEQRIKHLKRRFARDHQYHEDYKVFMETIINKGYAEKIPDQELEGEDGKKWYIPHHGVYHPQKRKIRVVFDCAAEFQGTSLNKELMQGPDLTNSLVGTLIRFRQEPVALMADIEAMFSQVAVPKEYHNFQRFLWWPEGDSDQPLQEYRMKVHIFGATSSPSCANYALKRTAEDSKKCYRPEVTNTIQNNFYVDDMLKSVSTNEQGVSLFRDLTKICKQGGFRLTKWISNHRPVLESIPEEERAKEVKNLDLDQDNLPMERALGMCWDVETDKFGFLIQIKDKPVTRRGILSVVSSVYDPLGIVAPAVLPPKMILQDLCKQKLGWDEQIPAKQQKKWEKWLVDLPKLEDGFSVNRCMKPKGYGEAVSTQLHHFSDASESGYGTVSYIRMVNNEDKVHCAFMLGKSRVAPLKQVTIPRMELSAATLAVRVDKSIKKELDMKVDETFFWTDSMTVLRYINNETARFHTFVANRVTVIREGSTPAQWRYVETSQNPADEASRGQPVDKFLQNKRWLNGPEFLWKPEAEWARDEVSSNSADMTQLQGDDLEVKREVTVNTVSVDESKETVNKLINHYSNWYALKKAVAWILRIKQNLMGKCKNTQTTNKKRQTSVFLSVKELQDAERAIISIVQQEAFKEEISVLKKHKESEKRAVKRASPVYKLDPMLGEDGLLRVGGRLGQSALPEEAKHPLILPKEAHISKLILRDIHETIGHLGRNCMISKLREKYWILRANTAARGLINECVTCRTLHPKTGGQKMSDLPIDRVTSDEPPFTKVGVDYFGPIEVKRGRSIVKRYGVIFTCLAMRAVHIEKADSLDTDSCINALRRFIARRGVVKVVRSDNGTNLVGTQRELKKEISNWNQAKIKGFLLRKEIDWIFNPPSGSHFGGVWERQIRTIRQILSAITKEQQLDDEGLQTLLCEVEHIINSRPITAVSDDARDPEALTPNMIITMKGASLPPSLTEKNDLYARRRWRQVQYMADIFWKRWTHEYLPSLQQRQKWLETKPNVAVGDIVLIADENTPRCAWPMAKVIEVMPDNKGLVRRVKVKTRSNVLERPIHKLCILLEADQDRHYIGQKDN